MSVVISGFASYLPDNIVSNQDLAEMYNKATCEGRIETNREMVSKYIEKVSGIKTRRFYDKKNVLDTLHMKPKFLENDTLVQVDWAMKVGPECLKASKIAASDVDGVIVATSYKERAYPSVAIELKNRLGTSGFAYDINLACNSMLMAILLAHDHIKAERAKRVLVISPEIVTPHVDFKDASTNFIFGDGCAACLVEDDRISKSSELFTIISTKEHSIYSSNIKNLSGFKYRGADPDLNRDLYFNQVGSSVYKDVVREVSQFVIEHIEENDISKENVDYFFLHQANLNMIKAISHKITESSFDSNRFPTTIEKYGNTSAASTMLTFIDHKNSIASGDVCTLTAFGAGYSFSNIILKKLGDKSGTRL